MTLAVDLGRKATKQTSMPNVYKNSLASLRHCNFGYLQILIKTYFKNEYFDAIQICFRLPSNTSGLWNCMIFLENSSIFKQE